jgi:preprotein translocase subunit SecG
MILFLLCGVILTLLILIQRGRGGGLAGAFGGAGGSSAFGTKTADIFIKATAVLGAIFFLLAIVTALLMHSGTTTAIQQSPAPVQTPAPSDAPVPAPSGLEPAPPPPVTPATPEK